MGREAHLATLSQRPISRLQRPVPGRRPPPSFEPTFTAFMDRTRFEDAQHTVDLAGLTPAGRELAVAYRDAGSGPAVVLIHGIATWSYLWEGVIERLAGSCRVLAPDLLGYGHSDHGDDFDRSVRRQARMIVGLLDALDVGAATVVGHDIGGAVAQVLAVSHSEWVERLALVDAVAYGSWPSSSMCRLGDPNGLDDPEHIMDILRRDARAGHAESADAEAFERDMVAPYDSDAGRRSMVRNASALNTNHTTELAPALPSVDVPSLVLWGEKDPWQPASDARRLRDDLDAELVTVENGSHWLPYDHPEPTAQALEAFVTA